MKKILFIVPGSYISGTEKVMLQIMSRLKSKGYSVVCFTSGWNDGTFIEELKKLSIPYKVAKLGFIYWRKPLWTLDTIFHYPLAVLSFLLLKAKFKPELIYHCSYRSIFILFPFLKNVQNILHVHDYPDTGVLNKIFFKYMQERTNKFVAVSESIKQSIINQGVNSSRIKKIYNGVFTPLTSMRQFVPWGNKHIINLGIVGQVIPRKGHHVLVSAIALLPQGIRERVFLNIFGNGDKRYIAELTSLISQYKLQDQVKWMGFEKNRDIIYQQLDIVVVPTILKEPFGLVAVEPALYGKLAIVADSGGLVEIIEDQKTGLVFQSNNSEDLKGKILWAIHNPNLIPGIIKAAQEDVFDRFNEDIMIHNIISNVIE